MFQGTYLRSVGIQECSQSGADRSNVFQKDETEQSSSPPGCANAPLSKSLLTLCWQYVHIFASVLIGLSF